MILEMDAGNTRIKWRFLTEEGKVGLRGASFSVVDIERAARMVPGIYRARIASVRDQEKTAAIRQWVLERWGVVPDFAEVTAEQAGVRNAYEDVKKMGVDRWLAMLAAHNQSEGLCCVVNCGTAITVDIIEESGQHRGGYIVPGLQLQRKALVQNTGIRLSDVTSWAAEWSSLTPGRMTEDAVNHGIYSMIIGWLQSLPGLREAAEGGALFLAGGDAETVSLGLKEQGTGHRCEPDIVLNGLAWALP